jgi:hypothetical protein
MEGQLRGRRTTTRFFGRRDHITRISRKLQTQRIADTVAGLRGARPAGCGALAWGTMGSFYKFLNRTKWCDVLRQ